MKHFVLLHNLIMMTRTSIETSVEGWTNNECMEVQGAFLMEVSTLHTLGKLTDYQAKKLRDLAHEIKPPIE